MVGVDFPQILLKQESLGFNAHPSGHCSDCRGEEMQVRADGVVQEEQPWSMTDSQQHKGSRI